MKKIAAVLIVAFLSTSMFLVTIPLATAATLPDYTPIDFANAPKYDLQVETTINPRGHHSYWEIEDPAVWLILNDYTGKYQATYFTLKAIGAKCEIWVQNNLAWPAGDPRATPTILDSQIQYLLNEFDNNVYPTDVEYFGATNFHDGNNAYLPELLGLPADYYAEEGGRNVILVSNIRDENYYNPTYPYYIAGFYSSSFEIYFDRNIISIDAYAWEKRIGPEGYEWIPEVPVDRPYLYEGTIAHEYQHLIHDDWNPADDLFMNEGCSMYAEYLCGYGIDANAINSYFYTPDNSLTIWGDQGDINILADYGVAALWTTYLSDHYGGAETIRNFVQNGIPGIDGINYVLAQYKSKQTFNDVFRDWKIANFVRANNGPYSYKTINLNSPDIDPINTNNIDEFPLEWTSSSTFGNTITKLGYDTGVSDIYSYGSDYITFTNWKMPGVIGFDGDDTAVIPGWTITADGWWSGTGTDLQNILISGTATVGTSSPELTMQTKYNIEPYWDFGFIQVSTDNGKTWTSLQNSYTTNDYDPNAHPDIIANLPGLTGFNPDWEDWTTMSFDLTAYAGQTILIGFRYMTDWATTDEGWWIKAPTVDGTPLTLTPVYPEASYQVTAVLALSTGPKVTYVPLDLKLSPNGWTGDTQSLFAKDPTSIVLIVSPTSRQGNVEYQFRAYRK